MIDIVVLTPQEPTPLQLAEALDAVTAIAPALKAFQDPDTGLLHLLESQEVIALTIEPARHINTPGEATRLLSAVGSDGPQWWTETHAGDAPRHAAVLRTFTGALAKTARGHALLA